MVLSDVKGHKQVQHTGGLIGTVTQFTLIPDMKLGIVVLTNQQSGAAFNTITNTVKDSYLGSRQKLAENLWRKEWLKWKPNSANKRKMLLQNPGSLQKKSAAIKAEQFTGTYNDIWFGDVEIAQQGNSYRISLQKLSKIKRRITSIL